MKPGVPKAAPHQRWMNTTISFGPSNCPGNMAGAGVLPLVTTPVISKVGSTLVEDLSLVFDRLRTTRTKLNPDTCIFGVSAGKLLGFLVSHRGIEANPAKIKDRSDEASRPHKGRPDAYWISGRS